jgi:hypothetical protein
MSIHDELALKSGGRMEIWISQAVQVGRFVEAHLKDLTKVRVAVEARAGLEAPAGAQAAARVLIWDPTRGGMKMPHLHYAGEIYILNEAQWAEFSKGAVSALAERMNKAQRVRFDDVMQLSEAVAGI